MKGSGSDKTAGICLNEMKKYKKCLSVESVSGPRCKHVTGSSGCESRAITFYCEWVLRDKFSGISGCGRDARMLVNL